MITYFIYMCAQTAAFVKVKFYQLVKYKASFCLTTEFYRKDWSGKQNLAVSELSRAIMTRDALLSRKTGEVIPIRSQTAHLTPCPHQKSVMVSRVRGMATRPARHTKSMSTEPFKKWISG